MDVALEMARGHLDGELAWIIGDILANRTAWWVPGKIVQARHRLKQYWQVGAWLGHLPMVGHELQSGCPKLVCTGVLAVLRSGCHGPHPHAQREGASRDVLLLDIALDSYFRLCVERTDLGSLRWGRGLVCELLRMHTPSLRRMETRMPGTVLRTTRSGCPASHAVHCRPAAATTLSPW